MNIDIFKHNLRKNPKLLKLFLYFHNKECVPLINLYENFLIFKNNENNLFKNININIFFNNNYEYFLDEIEKITTNQKVKKYLSSFISGKYNHLINKDTENIIAEIIKLKISKSEIKNLIFKKIASISSAEDFNALLKNILSSFDNYDDFFNELIKENIEIVHFIKDEIIIFKARTNEDIKKFGSTSWCIKNSFQFDRYTINNNKQFVILNFKTSEIKNKKIGVTTDYSGIFLIAAHDNFDKKLESKNLIDYKKYFIEINGFKQYLKEAKLDKKSKIISIISYDMEDFFDYNDVINNFSEEVLFKLIYKNDSVKILKKILNNNYDKIENLNVFINNILSILINNNDYELLEKIKNKRKVLLEDAYQKDLIKLIIKKNNVKIFNFIKDELINKNLINDDILNYILDYDSLDIYKEINEKYRINCNYMLDIKKVIIADSKGIFEYLINNIIDKNKLDYVFEIIISELYSSFTFGNSISNNKIINFLIDNDIKIKLKQNNIILKTVLNIDNFEILNYVIENNGYCENVEYQKILNDYIINKEEKVDLIFCLIKGIKNITINNDIINSLINKKIIFIIDYLIKNKKIEKSLIDICFAKKNVEKFTQINDIYLLIKNKDSEFTEFEVDYMLIKNLKLTILSYISGLINEEIFFKKIKKFNNDNFYQFYYTIIEIFNKENIYFITEKLGLMFCLDDIKMEKESLLNVLLDIIEETLKYKKINTEFIYNIINNDIFYFKLKDNNSKLYENNILNNYINLEINNKSKNKINIVKLFKNNTYVINLFIKKENDKNEIKKILNIVNNNKITMFSKYLLFKNFNILHNIKYNELLLYFNEYNNLDIGEEKKEHIFFFYITKTETFIKEIKTGNMLNMLKFFNNEKIKKYIKNNTSKKHKLIYYIKKLIY